jgi:hypothetical protein
MLRTARAEMARLIASKTGMERARLTLIRKRSVARSRALGSTLCKECGRVAGEARNLCAPEKL